MALTGLGEFLSRHHGVDTTPFGRSPLRHSLRSAASAMEEGTAAGRRRLGQIRYNLRSRTVHAAKKARNVVKRLRRGNLDSPGLSRASSRTGSFRSAASEMSSLSRGSSPYASIRSNVSNTSNLSALYEQRDQLRAELERQVRNQERFQRENEEWRERANAGRGSPARSPTVGRRGGMLGNLANYFTGRPQEFHRMSDEIHRGAHTAPGRLDRIRGALSHARNLFGEMRDEGLGNMMRSRATNAFNSLLSGDSPLATIAKAHVAKDVAGGVVRLGTVLGGAAILGNDIKSRENQSMAPTSPIKGPSSSYTAEVNQAPVAAK